MLNTLLIKMNLNILFLTTLVLGTLISISSTNWLGIWIGLELNTLSFVPLLASTKNIFSNEASLKYFLIQSVASIVFITAATSNTMFFYIFNNYNLISWSSTFMTSALLLKLGAAPLHSWFVSILPGLSWFNCLLLMTWQKITPLSIMFYMTMNQKFVIFFSAVSLIVGSLSGLNQVHLKKMLGFSSVNHIGWLLATLMLTKNIFILYFILYAFMNMIIIWISYMSNILNLTHTYLAVLNWSFLLSLLSLGGLPPFLGFLPKMIVLQDLMLSKNFFLSMILMMTTLVTLFFYLRIVYSWMLLYPTQVNFSPQNSFFPQIMVSLNTATIFGLFMWNLI